MNIPRLAISVILLVVFFFLFDFVVHQLMLGETYGATKEFWRPEAEMMADMWIMWACYFPIAIGFATIWALAFPGKGVKCGAIYGFLVSLMTVGGMMSSTVFTPTPEQVIVPWIVSGIVGCVLSGVLVALIYKPKAS